MKRVMGVVCSCYQFRAIVRCLLTQKNTASFSTVNNNVVLILTHFTHIITSTTEKVMGGCRGINPFFHAIQKNHAYVRRLVERGIRNLMVYKLIYGRMTDSSLQ